MIEAPCHRCSLRSQGKHGARPPGSAHTVLYTSDRGGLRPDEYEPVRYKTRSNRKPDRWHRHLPAPSFASFPRLLEGTGRASPTRRINNPENSFVALVAGLSIRPGNDEAG